MKLWIAGVPVTALVSFSLLSGCGVALPSEEVVAPVTPAVPGTVHIGLLHGSVFGGGIPIGNARVFLYAANQTGYGITTTGAVGTRSTSLLNVSGASPGFPISKDTVTTDITYGDYAVTTDPGGGFNITGDYTCTAGQQLYLVSLGGNPGYGGTNSAAGLMTALPNCPATGGTLAGTISYIFMNEVSTVAAAYAMAGFAHDAVHVGAPNNTLAQTGITNAFANAGNLYNFQATTAGHPALASGTTTNGGTITRPQATVNTLANILQYCVNTLDSAPTGTSSPTNQSPTLSTACTTLFGSTGAGNTGQTTAPTTPTATTATADTATAAIFMAQHPGTNVSNLYTHAVTGGTAYTPKLTVVPNDLTVQLLYSGGGMVSTYDSANNSYYTAPRSLAIDASGDAWIAGIVSNVVSAFSPLGAPLSSTGYTVGAANAGAEANSVAVDVNGYVWVTGDVTNRVYKLYATNTGGTRGATAGNYASGGTSPTDAELDASGNVWVTNYENKDGSSYGTLVELSSTGTNLQSYASTASVSNGAVNGKAASNFLYAPQGVGIAPSGLVAVPDTSSKPYVSLFTSADAASTYLSNFTNSPLPGGLAFDASGNGWLTEASVNVDKVATSNGVTPYTPGSTQQDEVQPLGIAADGNSNIWVTDFYNGVVYELNNAGTVVSPTYGYPTPGNSGYATTPSLTLTDDAIAVDGSGDVWYATANTTTNYVGEIIGVATPVATPIAYGLANSKLGTRP